MDIEKKFKLFSASIGVSSFGSAINFIAFNLFAYEMTKSPSQAGIVMIIRLVSSILSGLYLSRHKHLNHKKVLFYSDIIQLASLLFLVFLPGIPKMTLLYIVSFICGSASVCHSISLRSIVPRLVGPDRRENANGVLVLSRSTGTILGMAAGGIVLSELGYNAAFLIDAGTFLFSAGALFLLKLEDRPELVKAVKTVPVENFSMASLIGLFSLPLIAVFLAKGFSVIGNASDSVGISIHSSRFFPDEPGKIMGYFLASVSIGSVLSYKINESFIKARQNHDIYFMVMAALMSLFTIFAFFQFSPIFIILFALFAGMSEGLSEIYYVSHLQGLSEDVLTKVFSFSAILEKTTGALGMVIASFMLEQTTTVTTILVAHGIAFIIICMALLHNFYKLRIMDRSLYETK